MARALFLSLPAAGHINPSLSLVRELAARGEEVVYYATDAFADKIERARVRYCPYRNAFLLDMALPEHTHELSWLLMRTTAELLAEHLEEFRSERPDYVITDSVAPWGQWVGEILGVPVVTSVVTFAFNRHVVAYAASRGVRPKSARLFMSKVRNLVKAVRLRREVRRRYSASGPGIMGMVMGSSGLNIIYTSRHFQPSSETFDDRFQFIGPSLGDRGETPNFRWTHDKDVLYISLGTLFNADASFYKNCLEAFREAQIEVILSVGSQVSIESLGPAPANFTVRTHVPQLEVLRRATVFVTHGGMNSVCEGLGLGVPLVVVPQMSEQAIIGRRVEELGAGVYLGKEGVTAKTLRDAVQTVLGDARFRQRAGVIRESFESAGGVGRGAEAILSFIQKKRSLSETARGARHQLAPDRD